MGWMQGLKLQKFLEAFTNTSVALNIWGVLLNKTKFWKTFEGCHLKLVPKNKVGNAFGMQSPSEKKLGAQNDRLKKVCKFWPIKWMRLLVGCKHKTFEGSQMTPVHEKKNIFLVLLINS